MKLMICGGTVVTMRNNEIIRDGAVVIEDGVIVDVGKAHDVKRRHAGAYERINAKGKIVMPGLVNTHQHAAMSLLRGYADDLPLQEWLEKWIWPVEGCMSAHDIYVGALLTAIESIMGGTTTVNTMYHYMPEENEAKAFADAGLRGVIGHVCFSWRKDEDRKALEDLARNWHAKADGLIRASVDPHAPYTVDPEYMKELKDIRVDLNERYGSEKSPIMWHIHVAETYDETEKIRRFFNVKVKDSVMAYLDSLGVLDDHVLAAHCVAFSETDMDISKARGVKISHNPISNLKLASGISPITRMLEKGLTLSLGTDSPCSNNTADMFQTMKVAALLHKGVNRNPAAPTAWQVLKMATLGGAEALCWSEEIGSIEVGKKADVIILNLFKPHLRPVYNEISHLVYAARPEDVETVIINGRIVMENRKLTTLDVERVMEDVERTKNELLDRARRNIK
ncbi:MAG: amidohydrolase [Nitrososphaerota archaeon]|nr:amidohydrolase [Candidatus Bathyarchaeota archaeon]MDW8194056.1 amidohydrolase [Nitrososphaerota archaeon]